ncbi:MAG: hypothetical protein E6Q97_16455 [Desulfurellales bacterium]|nr:MAG: hypothetical protein E6Q97_16455 [Desulfurellales bacterium]
MRAAAGLLGELFGVRERGAVDVSAEDPNRVAFETACFAYYRDLKSKGWQHPDEGDFTAASLFWREANGKYGVHQIEAAWCGWQMCMRSADVAREHGYRLGYATGRADGARAHGTSVTPRVCPGCGYRMDPTQLSQARLDYTCPNCGKHRISEFREAA